MIDKVAVSPEEARRALGLGRSTIYALLREGSLRGRRVGRRVVIPVTELVRFLETEGASDHTQAGSVAPVGLHKHAARSES